jgi:Family of unknown function (DUF5317)
VGLALILLVAAAAAATAAGGSLARLSRIRLKGARLVVFAVLAQLAGVGLERLTGVGAFYPVGLAVSALAALAFCVRNRRLAGVPLITLGLLSNAFVVIANGTMPVSPSAAARAGVPTATIAAGEDPRHSLATPGTSLRRLGDDIAAPIPVRGEVVSPGDVLVVAGLIELVVVGMLPRGRRRPTRRMPAAVTLPPPTEEAAWPRRSASVALEPRTRPTTASARTLELPRRRVTTTAGSSATPPTHS